MFKAKKQVTNENLIKALEQTVAAQQATIESLRAEANSLARRIELSKAEIVSLEVETKETKALLIQKSNEVKKLEDILNRLGFKFELLNKHEMWNELALNFIRAKIDEEALNTSDRITNEEARQFVLMTARGLTKDRNIH